MSTAFDTRLAEIHDPRTPNSFLARLAPPHETQLTQSVDVGGIKQTWLGRRHAYDLPSGIQATFSKEGLLNKVSKLFWSEIQTGDETFDALVLIRSTTPEATRWLLSIDVVREAIGELVGNGGDITIDGRKVTITAWGAHHGDTLSPRTLAGLLAHISATQA